MQLFSQNNYIGKNPQKKLDINIKIPKKLITDTD